MKKLLSMILAIVMVASLAAVFAVNANATDGVSGLTVTLGTAYAEAGTTAWVDVYVKATALPAEYTMLRDWQFIFEGATVHEAGAGEEKSYSVLCYPEGSDYGFVNYGKNQIGNTTDSAAHCAEAAQVLCKGGVRIASVLFDVPAGSTGEIAVTVGTVDVMHFQNDTLTQFDVQPDVTVVAGKIVVVETANGVSAEYEGAGEDYVVPTTSTNGRITSMLNADGDPVFTGEFGTLVVPAAIVDVGDGIEEIESIGAIVLKSTTLERADATAVAGKGSSSNKLPVFILDRPNGLATTPDAFDSISSSNKKKVDVQYLLQPVGFSVEGNVATFIGGIAAEDTDFYDVAVEIKFAAQGRTFCTDTTKICYTVAANGTVFATTNADTLAAAAGAIDATAFAYISGASIKGMPAGDYTAEVTFYATTDDANGTPIVVCGNTVAYDFTIA